MIASGAGPLCEVISNLPPPNWLLTLGWWVGGGRVVIASGAGPLCEETMHILPGAGQCHSITDPGLVWAVLLGYWPRVGGDGATQLPTLG